MAAFYPVHLIEIRNRGVIAREAHEVAGEHIFELAGLSHFVITPRSGIAPVIKRQPTQSTASSPGKYGA